MGLSRSLSARLIVAFFAVSLLGILLVAAYLVPTTRERFVVYWSGQRAETEATLWVERYRAAGSWQALAGTQSGAPALVRSDPLSVIADPSGVTVIAGPGHTIGQPVPPDLLEQGTSIVVDGVAVGTLVPLREQQPPPTRNPFLQGFYRALLIAGLGAAGVALLLGVFLSRSLTQPLRELTAAAEAVARGELGVETPVYAKDELGQLAQAFNRMSSDLATAEQQRRQMTADIAHELRTPLSLILGHTEAIADGVLPATAETMGVIHDEARRLARLVDDLRTLSLADAGQLSLSLQPLHVGHLLRRIAAAHQPQAAEHGITLRCEVADDLPLAWADADRVAQVLGNLLSNALRHTPSGGSITLQAEPDAACVRLGVADTGPGIADEDLPRVFERFYRGDASRQRASGGSGLGLAIARSLVLAQGGAIWAESQPGQGATLWFTLPVAELDRV
jgi:signal transduction histidine kinase